jgi:two-component system cell cycle sensor histidine kinase/response regulator CckA
MNLVVNARDAMSEGGKLTLETRNVHLDADYASRNPPTLPGDYAMLIVRDTGCGMDAQTQARVFEPFFTTKEKGKGTGLGLSTVYGAVKQNGGFVWLESELGKGTTFKVYLPRFVGETQQNQAGFPSSQAHVAASETILLVEDEDSLRGLVENILHQSGYNVLVAANGSEAIRVAESHPGTIHLLLTDVVMPEMSGQIVAEKLTALRPGIKVIYMSGYTGYKDRGLLDQDVSVIAKPFTRDALLRKLRDALALHASLK